MSQYVTVYYRENNNVFRSLYELKRNASISSLMVRNSVDVFQVFIRKQMYGFRKHIYLKITIYGGYYVRYHGEDPQFTIQ